MKNTYFCNVVKIVTISNVNHLIGMTPNKIKVNKNKQPFNKTSDENVKCDAVANHKSISLSGLMPVIAVMVFAIASFSFLILTNSDYLFMVQEKSLFMDTSLFFKECIAVPGGLLNWLGCYFTQYFYYPWLGSLILVLFWVITYYALVNAFKLRGAFTPLAFIPVVALLCSIVDLGYWVYYIKIQGYWFAETLGFLISILAFWIFRYLNNPLKIAWIVLWTVFGYSLFGWFSLLSTLYMSIYVIVSSAKDSNQGRWIIPICGFLLVISVPVLWYNIYTQMRIEDSWTFGFPFFKSDELTSILPAFPFVVMAISPFVFLYLERYVLVNNKTSVVKTNKSYMLSFISVAVVSVVSVWMANYDNYNYHSEIRMYRATEEQRWQDVLDEMSVLPGKPTRQMVMLKNIALMNTGKLGSQMFHYENTGQLPYTYDSLDVHMVQTAATMIYYNFGKLNFAYRWAMENSVEFGFKVDDLKIMTKCSLLSGEYKLANKYINMLKRTTFHKKWAEEYEKYVIEPRLISNVKEFENVRELHSNFSSILDGDNGLCEMYLLNYFSNTMNKDSKLLQELTVVFSLVQKDIQLFWPKFFLYATLHPKEPMPIHYQEAAYLYGSLEPGTVDVAKMPFDKERIVNRYKRFQDYSQSLLRQGMSTEAVGEATRSLYGDTFWWFYFFCRDVQSY